MDTTLTDPLVGRVLDRRYRVKARLARGGMATVYTATDTRLDRTVAVKVMHPAYAGDPDFVTRFIREAKAAARLSHPNVVSVYDQGTDREVVFLVMEYVAGRTLRDLLAERGRLAPGEALSILEPLLAALDAAHVAGLVHRDVKPENVLLSDDGRVKVADFGLARAVEAANATASINVLIGTVAYLAPEQVAAGAADARSDVYAAGVVLYEMLTGAPPFAGDSPMAVAFRHVHEDVPRPSSVVRGLPAPIDDLVRRATARDPAGRFADAHAFLLATTQGRVAVGSERPSGRGDTVVLRRDDQATLVVPRSQPAGSAPASPRRSRRFGPGRWAALVVVLLTIAAAVGGWWLAVGRYVEAPRVIGLTKVQAEQRLDAAGLHVRWRDPVFSDGISAGLVAVSRPAPGRSVTRNGTVTLALSRGPHRLPDLRGRTQADAVRSIEGYGARATITSGWSDTVPAGSVISTAPRAGAVVRRGDTVALTVSKGRQPVRVPDVTGKPADEASAVLARAGFTVTTSQDFSDTVPKGSVIEQAPRAGAIAGHGTDVALTVSKGPQLFPIPNVHGMPVSAARRTLAAAGFRVNIVAPFGGGLVQAQSPRAGALRAHGTTVTIVAF